MFKYQIDYLMEEIASEIKDIFQKSKMLNEGKIRIFTLVFRQGDKEKLEDYKGINLVNCIVKMTTKLILHK